ncbi:NADH dehydrogenase subunit J [Anseongella ginsenosidimutans]|uniref:NADH-quinone oxidoreductase subunit J n=1 Tax=Anseongella ginsenosidimutans TaxID=496056 RepID=A0A4R3KVS8_9SPHI|nr:NADH-quinone oxidoreductase subunit J [Anseongella ginsenosidimutans]QEC51696.1 NADH-quinone oxidoreductase subunit J [Anseongella ginsenosidimutans]TCS89054.1 NADH dehydrogenase subunit J [Anseongella ginsenosidimutans]
MLTQSLFYFLSFLAVFSALAVIIAKNPVHSVLYLVLTFFAITGHYILLNAQFLAIVNVIVYAGAIMVLFLFVLMLLNLNAETEPQKPLYIKLAGVISGGLLLLVLIGALKTVDLPAGVTTNEPGIGLVENLGMVLFNEFLLPFELASVLLLTAMVGSVLIGRKEA